MVKRTAIMSAERKKQSNIQQQICNCKRQVFVSDYTDSKGGKDISLSCYCSVIFNSEGSIIGFSRDGDEMFSSQDI